MKRILVACEESQAVTMAFRKLGALAFSCDIQECSGGHPEWHIKGDCLKVLKQEVTFTTCDGKKHHIKEWDLIIAHPPCTYLSSAGNAWFNVERYGAKAIARKQLRAEAMEFFMACINAPAKHVCVENPLGYPNSAYKAATQIIQPWQFGDPFYKRTCLWLKGLPVLTPTEVLSIADKDWYQQAWYLTDDERRKVRSKTFPGIAEAMANQWIKVI